MIWNAPPQAEGRETEEWGRPLQVGGGLNKQRNLHRGGLSLVAERQVYIHTHQILKVWIEALTGLSHIYCPDVLNTTSLSQAVSLRQLLGAGKVGRTHIPRMGSRWASNCWGSAHGSTSSHISTMQGHRGMALGSRLTSRGCGRQAFSDKRMGCPLIPTGGCD